MAKLKSQDINKLNKEDRMKRIQELKLELIKARVDASKAGTSKIKQIKKTIARILTINNSENKKAKVENN